MDLFINFLCKKFCKIKKPVIIKKKQSGRERISIESMLSLPERMKEEIISAKTSFTFSKKDSEAISK